MERTPVESSAVISLGYESDTETLEIEFASGHVYQYRNVPQPIYDEMLQAPSLGQFVNASIRPVYPYEKV